MGAGNSNGTSMRLGSTSYDIYSSCFDGKPASGKPLILPDGPSKSVLFGNEVSFSFATHVGHNYADPKKRADDLVYSPAIRMINGEPIVHFRSGGGNEKKYHFSELYDKGRYSPIFCDEDLEIQKWRDVCEEGNKAISYSTPEKEGRLIEGPERLASFDSRDTQLQKFVTDTLDYQGPANRFGFYLSKNKNFKQDIRNILFDEDRRTRYDEDAVNFSEFLSEKYGTSRHTIGIGTEKTNAFAKIRFDDHHSYLIGSTDFHEKAKEIAEDYGLDSREAIEFFKKYAIYHEIAHNSQPRMSEKDAESDVSETLAEYFTKKAKDLEGTEEGKLYAALAAESEAYAESWKSGKGRNAKSKSRNLESRLGELEAEARSLGLEDGEAREYIARNLEEEVNQHYEENEEREPGKTDKGYEKVDDYHNNQTEEEEIGENPEDTDGCTD